jgi:hypothetical protein
MHGTATAQTRDRWKLLLLLILGTALLARLWGIDYGLPYSYWTDEYHELMRAMQLGSGSFNLARTTKGGFYLLLFVEYGFYYVVMKLTGFVASPAEFAEHFVRDPTMFYLIGRSTAAVFGCITVAAVFWFSRMAYSTAAGLTAALLLAVNVLHVDVSHRIGVDVPMTMFATISLCFAMRLATGGRRLDYLMAALFAALATTTKLTGILLLLPLLIAHTYAVLRNGGGVLAWIKSSDLWIAAGVFAAVLLATNPGFALYTTVGKHLPVLADADLDEIDAVAEQASADRPNLYVYYLNALLDSMGLPLFLASIAAVAYALWKRTPADWIIVSYALINYLVISGTSAETLYYPRYALPIVVVLAILAGRALSDVVRALPRWRPALAVIAVAVLAAWPVSEAITANHALTQVDTRTIAKDWFEANVPAGSRVLIEGGKTGPKRETLQLRESRSSLEDRIAYWREKEPRQAKFLEYKLAAHEGGGYELELVRLRELASLDEYAAAGVEYFVVRPDYFAAARKADAGAIRLLEELRSDSRVRLMRRFEPRSGTQPGSVVEIYRLDGAAGRGSN